MLGVNPAHLRLSGAGLEMAAYALLVGGLGYYFDLKFGWVKPWLGICGVLVGFSLGLYRLIRLASMLGNHETNDDVVKRHG